MSDERPDEEARPDLAMFEMVELWKEICSRVQASVMILEHEPMEKGKPSELSVFCKGNQSQCAGMMGRIIMKFLIE